MEGKEAFIGYCTGHLAIGGLVGSHEVHIEGSFGGVDTTAEGAGVGAREVFSFNVVYQTTFIGCIKVTVCTAE